MRHFKVVPCDKTYLITLKNFISFACIILFFIGAPLGAIIRKGGFGLPVLISVLFFLVYHVLSIIGEKSAKDLSMQAYEGIWLANIDVTYKYLLDQ